MAALIFLRNQIVYDHKEAIWVLALCDLRIGFSEKNHEKTSSQLLKKTVLRLLREASLVNFWSSGTVGKFLDNCGKDVSFGFLRLFNIFLFFTRGSAASVSSMFSVYKTRISSQEEHTFE